MNFIKKIMFNSCKKYAIQIFKSQIISLLNSSSSKEELESIVKDAIDPSHNTCISLDILNKSVAAIINSVSCRINSL